jgi:DNA topoisomerase I
LIDVTANLVIVESPTKAKTIEKYLGKDFKVLASYGHVRDLPRSDFAIEVADGGVELAYEVPKSSAKHVSAIRKAAKEADRVFLATDLDREGEAIAWHVAEVAGIDTTADNRVVFDEITRDAILAAFEQPHAIDAHLVDAQQARRAVDRIVGYRLSPTLWRNVASGISAGRVQSVALRLIVDREDEIRALHREEYWSLHGVFAGRPRTSKPTSTRPTASAWRPEAAGGEGPQETSRALPAHRRRGAAHALVARSPGAGGYWTVRDVKRREVKRNPAPPFTTSTLQQEAARKLGFSRRRPCGSPSSCTRASNVGEGPVGLITYMRTDSLNLSNRRWRAQPTRRATTTATVTASTSRAATRARRRGRRRRTRRSARPARPAARSGRAPCSTRTSSALRADLEAHGGHADGAGGLRLAARRHRGADARRGSCASARPAR